MGKAVLSEGSETLINFCNDVKNAKYKLEEELDKIINLLNSYNSVWQDAVYNHMAEALNKHWHATKKNLEILDGLIYALDKMAEHVYDYQNG